MLTPLYGQLTPLTLARRHGAWSPRSLPGLQLWLRADAGAYADLAKTTPAAGGGTVACWADQSGQGNDATQATAGSRPVFTPAAQNGLPALSFAGAYGLAVRPVALTDATVFAAFQETGISDDGTLLGSSVTADSGVLEFQSQSIYWVADDGTFCTFAYGAPVAGWRVLSVSRSSSVLTVSQNGDRRTAAGSSSVLTVGLIGTRAPGHNLGGSIAELLVYNSALSDADRSKVDAYLNAKYSIF